MQFFSLSAPYWRGNESIAVMMMRVNIALLPVIIVSSWCLGPGILINLLFACLVCLALEALMLRLRNRPVQTFITDGSALVTAALIALAIPPQTPWWVTATACCFAIVFAKHLYGGIGYNVFNPAMVGYVVALVSFPQYIALWPDPETTVGLTESLQFFVSGTIPLSGDIDSVTSATPLDTIKIELGQMRTMDEISTGPIFGLVAGRGWELINLAALTGGIWLLHKKVIRWHIPAAMLGSMAALYCLFYLADPSLHAGPIIGLFSGGTMLGAFFVATDPVSAATTDRGRLLYGAGIGTLCFVIRQWGAYPDGLAFAVLLMNMAAPLIDRYTLPRIYGHDMRP